MNELSRVLTPVRGAEMPSTSRPPNHAWLGLTLTAGAAARSAASLLTGLMVVFIYIGVPITLLVVEWFDSLIWALLFAGLTIASGTSIIMAILHSTSRKIKPSKPRRKPAGESVIIRASRQVRV